jgi:hypothetical protein
MTMITDASWAVEDEAEALAFAREVLRIEADALERVRARLGVSIARAAELVYRCPGSVIVTGMGKAGLVGQKLAGTLCSTGTRAFPLHPADAVHGDLGRVRRGDVVVAISTGGRSPAMARRAREELERIVPPDWGELLEVAAAARERLGSGRARVPAAAWQAALGATDLRRLVISGHIEEAIEHLLGQLEPVHG